MAAVDDLFDWIGAALGGQWTLADGAIPANGKFEKSFICVVQGRGGPSPDVDDRRPRYRLVLMGPEKRREDKTAVRNACEGLMQLILGESAPCGVAGIKALGEPIGPAYTAEDRAWMSLELQITY